MVNLRDLGLDKVLKEDFEVRKPILGICLGAQIILEASQENDVQCLGLIKGDVKLFPRPLLSEENNRLKIPHMGWNGVHVRKSHPVLKGIMPADEFYFVHAYYPLPAVDGYVVGTTSYGIEFPSIIGYENLIAVQFHPEKSKSVGDSVIKYFISLLEGVRK